MKMNPLTLELKPLETVRVYTLKERMPKENEAILFGSTSQPIQYGRVIYPPHDPEAKQKGYCFVQVTRDMKAYLRKEDSFYILVSEVQRIGLQKVGNRKN